MHVLDAIAETYGVEYIGHADDTYTEVAGFDYLNTGGTYTPTIVRFADGRYRVASWGDIVESNPKYGSDC
jgi:hypothetical protein